MRIRAEVILVSNDNSYVILRHLALRVIPVLSASSMLSVIGIIQLRVPHQKRELTSNTVLRTS